MLALPFPNFWDSAAEMVPQAGVARDRLFSGALALPEELQVQRS